MKEKSLEKIRFEDNSWGAIRLLCCVLIMFSHYCVKVFGDEVVCYKPLLFAGSSLVVFFCLCGFLVGPSVLRNSKIEFLKKRIIRLYPVFVATLVATVLVVIISGQYVSASRIIEWFVGEIICWRGRNIGGVSNGAIWAISIQIQFYFFSVFTYKYLHSINSKVFWVGLLLFSFILNITYVPVCDYLNSVGLRIVRGAYRYSFIPYYFFFLIGMFAYKYFDSIVPILRKYAYILLIVHLVWHMGFIKMPPPTWRYTDPITVLTASMAAIGLAYRLPRIKIKNDLSYDIFCWHMPVITGFALYSEVAGWTKVLMCISITLILSYLTNKYIERKLTIKNKHVKENYQVHSMEEMVK